MMDDKTRNRVLLVLFIGVLMGALDIAIIGPALPVIKHVFGVDDRAGAWTFTIYVLFNLIGTPLMAKLSDAFGRRSIYVIDVGLFLAGSLVAALSSGAFLVLLAGRALQGLGAGGIFPVASAVIGDTFPPEKRGSALGLIGAVFGIAFLFGPLLAVGILSVLSWQWLFIINLPVGLVVIFMSLRTLPETRPERRPVFDWPGMLVLGVLLAALTIGISQIDTKSFAASLASLSVWPLLLLALVLVPIFYRLQIRASDPVLNIGLFRSRQSVLALVLSAGAGLGEVGMVFIPPLAVAALGIKETRSGEMLLPVVLAMAVGSPVVGRLLDRYGSRVIVLTGTALLTIGLGLLSTLSAQAWYFYAAGVLIGLGLSALLGAPVRYIMLNEVDAAERASAQGAITLFTSIGQLISSSLIGSFAASLGGGVTGYSGAYRVIGVVALVMTLLALGLKSRRQEQASQLNQAEQKTPKTEVSHA